MSANPAYAQGVGLDGHNPQRRTGEILRDIAQ